MNVEDLKGKLLDSDFLDTISCFDFVTSVETWLPTTYDFQLNDFYYFSVLRNKHNTAKRFSGGINLLVRKELRKGIKIIDDKHEALLWWKMSKEYFSMLHDIFIWSTYIPPSNS